MAEEGQRRSVMAYRKVGETLIAAKALCGHGGWLKWLKANVPFSERQAQNYMRLAKSAVTADLDDQWRIIQGNDDQQPQTGNEGSGGEGGTGGASDTADGGPADDAGPSDDRPPRASETVRFDPQFFKLRAC